MSTEDRLKKDYWSLPYIVLEGATPLFLAHEVREGIIKGFVPQGGVSVTYDSEEDEFHYVQAMVKRGYGN